MKGSSNFVVRRKVVFLPRRPSFKYGFPVFVEFWAIFWFCDFGNHGANNLENKWQRFFEDFLEILEVLEIFKDFHRDENLLNFKIFAIFIHFFRFFRFFRFSKGILKIFFEIFSNKVKKKFLTHLPLALVHSPSFQDPLKCRKQAVWKQIRTLLVQFGSILYRHFFYRKDPERCQ